ncbi:MAG: hypothetical protein M0P91_13255 [Sulfuricurvum sp.]|jgi:hypothetical protein|uniref:DUF6932 family protein n=1 Tax=Sulfuricurvum sp. TaxID=2025608 RepID=UPI0025F20904|nr:hypothetical protein [Sulfuricurvum sp.]MCK9374146.1 hypothetical protein [Sulfuricurvum sp.]
MIPDWNISGLIPPIRPDQPGHSPERSPYRVGLMDIVNKFSETPERRNILSGLLRYRQALHNLGMIDGFQWLDGSFMENVETTQNRNPNDIDVVTFFMMPDGMTQEIFARDHMSLFNPEYTKDVFKVDAYPVELGYPTDNWYVRQISYWYSMWSHTRQEQWKGFLEIDLSPIEDAEALAFLHAISNEGGVV